MSWHQVGSNRRFLVTLPQLPSNCTLKTRYSWSSSKSSTFCNANNISNRWWTNIQITCRTFLQICLVATRWTLLSCSKACCNSTRILICQRYRWSHRISSKSMKRWCLEIEGVVNTISPKEWLRIWPLLHCLQVESAEVVLHITKWFATCNNRISNNQVISSQKHHKSNHTSQQVEDQEEQVDLLEDQKRI